MFEKGNMTREKQKGTPVISSKNAKELVLGKIDK